MAKGPSSECGGLGGAVIPRVEGTPTTQNVLFSYPSQKSYNEDISNDLSVDSPPSSYEH